MHAAPQLETEFESFSSARGRVARGVGLIAASVITLLVTAALYVRPGFDLFARPATSVPALSGDYRVAAMDFVNGTTGWLVVDFPSGDYAVIHTADAGTSWSQQLTAASEGHAKYLKFFDQSVGVFALVGTRPVLRRTSDGGRTWSSLPALDPGTAALSWSFVDSDHGWLLAARTSPTDSSPARLHRTDDGGRTWLDLGPPVPEPDRAFQVHFSYLTTGWLTTVSSGPFAYRSQDFGATWSRVPLPPSDQGWPAGGEFFVAVRPTAGQGVVASVVHFASFQGRSGAGGTVRAYPPLTVRSFDGGRLRTYLYTTLLDQLVTGPFAEDTPPNQAQLGTTDGGGSWSVVSLPSTKGAVGFYDAAHWWWIGDGLTAGSADGGVTWTQPTDIGVITPLPGSLQVLDRQHAWFAGAPAARALLATTEDGGVHWTSMALPLLEDRPGAVR